MGNGGYGKGGCPMVPMGMGKGGFGKGGCGKGPEGPYRRSGGSAGGTGDIQKDALVSRIKEYQRSADEAKQTWWAYCDHEHGGVRDPVRHDVATLMASATTTVYREMQEVHVFGASQRVL